MRQWSEFLPLWGPLPGNWLEQAFVDLQYVDDLQSINHDQSIHDWYPVEFHSKKRKRCWTWRVWMVLEKMMHANGTKWWTQSTDEYLADATTVEAALAQMRCKLLAKSVIPWSSWYKPELNTSAELSCEEHQYYQELVGMWQWSVELGQLQILSRVYCCLRCWRPSERVNWSKYFISLVTLDNRSFQFPLTRGTFVYMRCLSSTRMQQMQYRLMQHHKAEEYLQF